jgi:uncharacterized protein YpuA (DUF1002 family)
VKIKNNVFEETADKTEERQRFVIDVETSMNIEISDNTCSKNLKSIINGITAKNYRNLQINEVTLDGDV